jgi:hypothetical protein
VDQAEQNPLADGEGDDLILAVIEVLVLLLCLFESLPHLKEELVAIMYLSLHCRNARFAQSERADDGGSWP